MKITKNAFLNAYRERLIDMWSWASDQAKLDRFMDSVETTIKTDKATWVHDGKATTAAWRSLGGKGKPTLKALRELPLGVAEPVTTPDVEASLALAKRITGEVNG